ncbi:MAG: hypothetical protein ACTSUE_15790 [Promethearchaeota archaeon]
MLYRKYPSSIKRLVLFAMIFMTLMFFSKLFTTSCRISDYIASRYFYDLTFLFFISSLYLFNQFGIKMFLATQLKANVYDRIVDASFISMYILYFARSIPQSLTGIRGPETWETITVVGIVLFIFLLMVLFLIMGMKGVSLYRNAVDTRKRKGFLSLSIICFLLSLLPIIVIFNLLQDDYNKVLELLFIIALIFMNHFVYTGFIKPSRN